MAKRWKTNRDYDDETVARIVHEVEEAVDEGRTTTIYPRKGRPSLTGKAQVSPSVGFRLTPELRTSAEKLARKSGVSISELARLALEEYVRRAG